MNDNDNKKGQTMQKKLYLVYYDESGDDGNPGSSTSFVLSCIYMDSNDWQDNFNKFKEKRQYIKKQYKLPISEEFHTKQFLTDKNPYRQYKWTNIDKKNILNELVNSISELKIKSINIVIDKTKIKNKVDYNILKEALTYSIQRIDNDSNNEWNYILVTDKGRVEAMRKISRAMRVYNPIPSNYYMLSYDSPIKNMIEDIFDKESKDSYFIQISDFLSYIVHLYYDNILNNKKLPNRLLNVIEKKDIVNYLDILKDKNILNLKASNKNEYGVVIYPK